METLSCQFITAYSNYLKTAKVMRNTFVAVVAVSKTKDISCDGASQLLGPSLCDENGEDSCDVASRVPFPGYMS